MARPGNRTWVPEPHWVTAIQIRPARPIKTDLLSSQNIDGFYSFIFKIILLVRLGEICDHRRSHHIWIASLLCFVEYSLQKLNSCALHARHCLAEIWSRHKPDVWHTATATTEAPYSDRFYRPWLSWRPNRKISNRRSTISAGRCRNWLNSTWCPSYSNACGHKFKLFKHQTTTEIGRRASLPLSVLSTPKNVLPENVNCSSSSAFKCSVKRVNYAEYSRY